MTAADAAVEAATDAIDTAIEDLSPAEEREALDRLASWCAIMRQGIPA